MVTTLTNDEGVRWPSEREAVTTVHAWAYHGNLGEQCHRCRTVINLADPNYQRIRQGSCRSIA